MRKRSDLRRIPAAVLIGLALCGGRSVRADLTAITSGPGGSATFPSTGVTYGYQFIVGTAITVTALGVDDFGTYTLGGTGGTGGTLHNTENHDVGIFNSGGTLLVSGTVAPNSSTPDANGFVFNTVTQTVLAPGMYQIGAFYSGINGANGDGLKLNTDSVTTSPGITYVPGGAVALGSSLTNPNLTPQSTANSYFGPNFQFFDTVSTPEPSAFVMSGLLALGGLGYLWRQRRRSTPATF